MRPSHLSTPSMYRRSCLRYLPRFKRHSMLVDLATMLVRFALFDTSSRPVSNLCVVVDRASMTRLQSRTNDVAAMTSKINRSLNFVKVAAQCGARVSSQEVLNIDPESQINQSSRVGVGSAIDRAILDFRKTLVEMNQLAYQLFTVDLPG
jgi:hypothetical protein